MKKVYLDQCVVSHLAGDVPQDWRQTKYGSVVAEAMTGGRAEVWATPTHVLETLLCADYGEDGRVIPGLKAEKRQRIARILLELTEGRRMFCGYEFLLVGEFLEFLRNIAPDCVRTHRIFERLKRDSQNVWAGALALIASLQAIDRPAAASPLIRSKVTTQLLHSRFAKDPDRFAEELVAVATEFRLTDEDLFRELDARPLSDIRDEIGANLASPGKLGPKARAALEKHRALIAAAYGAADIGQSLDAVFGDIWLILMTIDTVELRRQWEPICTAVNVKVSMPKEFAVADDVACCSDPRIAVAGLTQFFRHVSRDALLTPRLAQQVILGQLEIALNRGEVPTGGVGFDAEHAAILTSVNVFATTDTQLEHLAKRAAKQIAHVTKGAWQVEVVSTLDQLRKALA